MIRIFYFSVLCLFFSCDIINPEEDIPAFIEIGSFTLNARPNTGSNNQNITEGWVFVDNVLIGAFSPGKPFPVLEAGTKEIIIDAGIHDNGISAATKVYPYYTRYRATVDLVPGQVTQVNPEFEYRDNIEFLLIEEFDNSTVFTIDRDGNAETTISFEANGALEGLSAKVTLNEENPDLNVASNMTFNLPTFGLNDTYLEVNFKSEVPIAIGLLVGDNSGNVQQLYANGLNSTAEWKKVYINLSDIINTNPNPPFQVGFGASLSAGLSEATIMLDNIKLLHFKQ